MDDEIYGIDKEYAHKRALDLISEDFFWDCVDELAPFGSDEGDTALAEFRDWVKENPNLPTYDCLKWTIESVGEIPISAYNSSILSEADVRGKIDDEGFDDIQYIWTLDISAIATGFAQLVDQGHIDDKNKPLIKLALERQKIYAVHKQNWAGDQKHNIEYIRRMNVLLELLEKA